MGSPEWALLALCLRSQWLAASLKTGLLVLLPDAPAAAPGLGTAANRASQPLAMGSHWPSSWDLCMDRPGTFRSASSLATCCWHLKRPQRTVSHGFKGLPGPHSSAHSAGKSPQLTLQTRAASRRIIHAVRTVLRRSPR